MHITKNGTMGTDRLNNPYSQMKRSNQYNVQLLVYRKMVQLLVYQYNITCNATQIKHSSSATPTFTLMIFLLSLSFWWIQILGSGICLKKFSVVICQIANFSHQIEWDLSFIENSEQRIKKKKYNQRVVICITGRPYQLLS